MYASRSCHSLAPGRAMPQHAMLHKPTPRCAMLRHAMLRRAMPCHVKLSLHRRQSAS